MLCRIYFEHLSMQMERIAKIKIKHICKIQSVWFIQCYWYWMYAS